MKSKLETGPGSAGQAGDLQGLTDTEDSSSESVADLLEEGQPFEASLLDGIENAPVAGEDSEIVTREVPEDDVPEEYLEDEDPPR